MELTEVVGGSKVGVARTSADATVAKPENVITYLLDALTRLEKFRALNTIASL
jgi:hypothetical protein